nr:uncharacterized protein LOC111998166 [Quercus suber]
MSGSNAESGLAGSSRGFTWREQRQKRREDPVYEQLEERSGLGEGSYQTGRTASHASWHRQPDARDEELERLRRLVRDLELEARNERRRAGQDDRGKRPDAEEERRGMGSNQSGSRLHRERSHSRESRRRRDRSNSAESRRWRNRSRSREYGNRGSGSPEGWPRNAAMDAMSRALRRAARSPFSADIERAPMPDRFTRPPFNSYGGKTDPVEHVFPSSLGPTALRWFNGLRKGSIHSFAELIHEFGSRFVTCSREQQPVDALLSMKMRAGETLRDYASRYWELYNEIGGGNEKIAVSTFRMGLPDESGLRESLTKKPLEDMRQLMRRIEEYKRLEDDRIQSKGKAQVTDRPRQSGFQQRARGNLRIQEPVAPVGEVNVTFKEPVHKIVDKIKHEPYFRWPNQMAGDPSRRNQNLYCTYHKDRGHTTKQCRVLRDHLGQLAKAGHLKDFVTDAGDRGTGHGAPHRGNPLPPPLGIIDVIHVATRGISTVKGKEVLTVISVEGSTGVPPPAKKIRPTREPIAFGDSDLEGTIQPHDDALIVTARIGGFVMKRIMIDQGSGADVMYPDLFRGLGLRDENLSMYNTPLVGFDGKMVAPKGQISLPVNMGGKEVMVRPYTAILGRPWIHAMGAVPSTLHMKVKFHIDCGVTVIQGSQQAARQCLIAMVDWKKEQTDQKDQADPKCSSSGTHL